MKTNNSLLGKEIFKEVDGMTYKLSDEQLIEFCKAIVENNG